MAVDIIARGMAADINNVVGDINTVLDAINGEVI